MFKFIGFVVKLALFAAVVLVLGSVVQWRGKSISDQVKSQLAHAERNPLANELAGKVRGWSGKLLEDSREGARQNPAGKTKVASSVPGGSPKEEIAPSERQKLRALIKELNSSQQN